MGYLPMPFYTTNGALIYTEQIRQSQKWNKSFDTNHDNSLSNEGPDKYTSKLMNSIWGLYNRYAPFQFQKNIEASKVQTLNFMGTKFERF